ncbi:MAG: hypothetical protein H0W65_06905 [Sphingomonas sp.]|uniref:hypothetical protein n=1 Tax=Sphingomonas sp. TaxID=28214 RepID=UPI0017AE87CD|nr:hypothetical protein [Sphingomonas sp.]MBA3667435.1 hypothetical protein [Sphingomonas sp.]
MPRAAIGFHQQNRVDQDRHDQRFRVVDFDQRLQFLQRIAAPLRDRTWPPPDQ